ncbi:CDP-alcohol phosphatidyltransferase family protein [Flagellimonas sp. DF-77]|uniref:CDP-alcohol phosphatidyltransferase family protein n=1 Tax=Flagellimonas algarum TaxID=3230298 RepID=UPI0033957321
MKRHIPNFITLLNLFSGCIAVVFAVFNRLELAALFVLIGIFFDFFDGLAARMLKVSSPLGVQLDSLADMVTSGLVPGIVMFQLLHMSGSDGAGTPMVTSFVSDHMLWQSGAFRPVAFFGFIITMASAYRLAKFNIDENQTSSFIGLPTPANTLLILSLPMILYYQNTELLGQVILNQWFLLGMTFLSAYLMNSKIELFAFKLKDASFKKNGIKYLFLIGAVVLLFTLRFLAVPFIILGYILASILERNLQKT